MIRLVRAELHLMEAALEGDDALARALGHDVVAGRATFTEALRPTRDALAADATASAWGARFFVAGDPPELVGWGGFKGPPKDGVVELGFEIAEARRGRGLAAAATRAMLAEAFADEWVTAVIAHTLPEGNASNRVLEKAGFRFEGEAQEDGEVVWRFSKGGPAQRARSLPPAISERSALTRAPLLQSLRNRASGNRFGDLPGHVVVVQHRSGRPPVSSCLLSPRSCTLGRTHAPGGGWCGRLDD